MCKMGGEKNYKFIILCSILSIDWCDVFSCEYIRVIV